MDEQTTDLAVPGNLLIIIVRIQTFKNVIPLKRQSNRGIQVVVPGMLFVHVHLTLF